MSLTDLQEKSWNCERCEFELVEVGKNTIAEIVEILNPNFMSLPRNWKSNKSEWIKICPRCDAYSLGMELEHPFSIRTRSGDKTTINNIDFVKAHKNSDYREEILKSEICGCFYCTQTFSPDEIFEWWGDEESGVEPTAVCPKCGIDSVIGSASGFPIDSTFLSKMRDFWFSPCEVFKTIRETTMVLSY